MSAIPSARLNILSVRILESDAPYQVLEGAEWTIKGYGVGRIAATHDCLPEGTIAKFGRNRPQDLADVFAAGTVQNAVEAAVWTSTLALRQFCAPIIALDARPAPYWQIVPECGPADTQTVWSSLDELEAFGYESRDLLVPDHWGSFQNQPVCFDYGYAHPEDLDNSPLLNLAVTVDSWQSAYAQSDYSGAVTPLSATQ